MPTGEVAPVTSAAQFSFIVRGYWFSFLLFLVFYGLACPGIAPAIPLLGGFLLSLFLLCPFFSLQSPMSSIQLSKQQQQMNRTAAGLSVAAMTVEELIKELEEWPQHLKVAFGSPDGAKEVKSVTFSDLRFIDGKVRPAVALSGNETN